ncbi:MAG: hypothetical protein AB8B87_19110 [Granulosicoccus sp.]
MRNYHPDWVNWALKAPKCLTIGTYCALCAQSSTLEVDLCTSCLRLFKARLHTDRSRRTTVVCLGCGLEQFSQATRIEHQHTSLTCAGSKGNDENSPSLHSSGNYCADCALGAEQYLTQIIAPYRYAFPVDRLIKRIKYREDRQLTRVLGTLLAEAVRQNNAVSLPEMLLPMPLHASRLRRRGFNQAMDLALWCGKSLGIRVEKCRVSRIVDTGSLAGLNRQERQLLILGAFRADSALVGKRVAIIDDVLTTGASARELAREIYDSGAESVELWVLARTSSRREGADEI